MHTHNSHPTVSDCHSAAFAFVLLVAKVCVHTHACVAIFDLLPE